MYNFLFNYVDNIFFLATKHSKIFPGVASESDLQRWRASKERKSPSLSQMGSDSVKHKVSQITKYIAAQTFFF